MPLFASLMAAGALSGALISPSKYFIIAAYALIILFAVFLFLKRDARFRIVALFAIAFAIGFALSGAKIRSINDSSLALMNGKIAGCEGFVSRSPETRKWGGLVDVNLENCGGGKARLSINTEDTDLLPGDRVRFRAKFYLPREYKNPGVFSWRDYLAVHGIGREGRVYGKMEKLGNESFILSYAEKIRQKIADAVAANMNPPELGVVLALANGDQSKIAPDLRDLFANTGLAHLIAISGMNVAYVAAFLYFILKFIFGFFPRLIVRVPSRILSSIVTLPAVWGYVLLTGSAISAVRAGIMLTVLLIGILIGRRQDLLSTLAVSVVVILLIFPLSVFDVSFQLSSVAVAGIILITPAFIKLMGGEGDRRTRRGRIVYWMRALIAVSFAAGIATLPVVAYHFKFISGIGFIANLIAVPMTGALLSPVVAAASLVSMFSAAASAVLWKASGLAASLFIGFTRVAAQIGEPLIMRLAPSIVEVAIFFVVIALVVFREKIRNKKLAFATAAAFIFLNVGCNIIMEKFDDNLIITVLDVGQGDSSVIRFPNGKVMMIDGGGIRGSEFDIGRNVVAPALWKMGIDRVDLIVLTHPHHDHYRGLSFIVGEFKPGIVFTNGLDAPPDESGGWDDFKKQVNLSGAKFANVGGDGIEMEEGGVAVKISKSPMPDDGDLNDTSMTIRLRHGSKKIIFTGDLSARGEARLIETGGDLSADFLKAGHHGSADASSNEFLHAVSPDIVAISAGERNQYGFPSKDALSRIEKTGAKILRTDQDGAITIESDGKNLEADTFVKR